MESAEVDPFPSSLENPEKGKKEGSQTERKKLSGHDGFGSNSTGGIIQLSSLKDGFTKSAVGLEIS
jgi:hypothetical protein